MEEQRERILERVLPNGDVHIGPVEGFIPKGEVNYERVDGTIFGEEWERYTISGKGKFIWASGSIYEGDFYGSSLHGFGILNGVDGSIYEGSWRMNVRHGLGKNIFPNLDIFEGSWREGMPDGFGRYAWSNGNLYIGNWKSGKMHGRGIMKWENGDVYDGFWLDGVKHGMGCHRFADGSYFLGTWSGGLKDGHGVFYPSGSGHPFLDSWYHSLTWTMTSFEGQLISSIRGRKLRSGGSISCKWPMREFLKYSGRISNRNPVDSCDQPQVNTGRYSSSVEGCMPVYEQEYAQGMLIMEKVKLSKCGLPDRIYKMFRSKDVIHPCRTIIMGDKSYYLILNLQLGIRYTVGKITPVPMREVRSSDFGPRARIKMYFPRSGSQSTPSHCSSEFFWEDYCPMVFRNLREMFRLDAADYMMSICAGDSLKELSSPGKSGSIFYLSQDERFVIKTLRQSELKVLLKMLPDYYNHVRTYENTLITKFFGLHRITLNSRRVRFVVMGNMFRTELRIHRRYDLKGSSHGRSTDPHRIDGNTTLKDLDLPYVFYLEKSWHDSLFKQIILDCMFLKSQHIIDYSLLLGIHFRAPENLKSLGVLQDSAQRCNPALKPDTSLPSKSLLLVTHEPNSSSATPGLHIRGSTLRASSVGNEEVDLLLPDAGRLRVQLGVNMPARADWNRQGVDHSESTVEFCLGGVYDVVLYFGIIDILQDFNMKKKIEHGLKSFRFDPMTISSVEPNLYAKRFISFLERVFQEMKH